MMSLWWEQAVPLGQAELMAVAVPVGAAWGASSHEMMFNSKLLAAEAWIKTVCMEMARLRGLNRDDGEPHSPRIIWSC